MGRYVFRYSGEGEEKPAGKLKSMIAANGLQVLEETANMLLVSGAGQAVEKLKQEMPDWLVFPEVTYEVPDTRVRIKKRSSKK